jgi:hypothetical protein
MGMIRSRDGTGLFYKGELAADLPFDISECSRHLMRPNPNSFGALPRPR